MNFLDDRLDSLENRTVVSEKQQVNSSQRFDPSVLSLRQILPGNLGRGWTQAIDPSEVPDRPGWLIYRDSKGIHHYAALSKHMQT